MLTIGAPIAIGVAIDRLSADRLECRCAKKITAQVLEEIGACEQSACIQNPVLVDVGTMGLEAAQMFGHLWWPVPFLGTVRPCERQRRHWWAGDLNSQKTPPNSMAVGSSLVDSSTDLLTSAHTLRIFLETLDGPVQPRDGTRGANDDDREHEGDAEEDVSIHEVSWLKPSLDFLANLYQESLVWSGLRLHVRKFALDIREDSLSGMVLGK